MVVFLTMVLKFGITHFTLLNSLNQSLSDAINEQYGSFDKFKDEFTKSAATLFGAGWAWLVKNSEGKLEIIQESNAGNPLRDGKTPILTCDV